MPQDDPRANLPNAIAYANYLLGGGRRAIISVTAVTAMIAIGAFVIAATSISLRDARPTTVWPQVHMLMVAGELLLVGVIGTACVNGAIRRDLTNGMIESHRLTPDPPHSAAAGYIFGPQIVFVPSILICVAGWFAASQLVGYSFTTWMRWQMCIIVGAPFLWTIIALMTFVTGSAAAWLVILILAALSRVLVYVPAALAIIAPAVIQQSAASVEPLSAIIASLAATVILTAIFFRAVGRLYRFSGADAFGVAESGALMIVWAALTAFGLFNLADFDFLRLTRDISPAGIMMIGWASCIVLACLPVAAAVRVAERRPETYAPGDAPRYPALRWMLLGAYALIAWLPTELSRRSLDSHFSAETSSAVLVMTIIFITAVGMLFAASTLVRSTGWGVLLVWLTLSNGVPLAIGAVYYAKVDSLSEYQPTAEFWQAASPFGAIALMTNPFRPVPWASIGVQALAALGPALLRISIKRPKRLAV